MGGEMSFQEKNITVSLVNFTLILGFYLSRMVQMIQNDNFTSSNVFRMWGVVIVLAVVLTILAMILTHVVSAVVQTIQSGGEGEPEIDDTQDERDKLIDLKGTKVTHMVSSGAILLSMLTFVFGQPALVMFSLLILSALVAQIVGDIARLYFYRRGV